MIKNDTEVFSGQEILDNIRDNIQDYEGSYFDDLFNGLFNSDYCIIGTYKAGKELEKYVNNEDLDGFTTMLNGVFGAIDLVKQYEENNYCEVNTDLANPEQVANMVEYIRAENVLNIVLDDAELDISDAIDENNIKTVLVAIKNLEHEGF